MRLLNRIAGDLFTRFDAFSGAKNSFDAFSGSIFARGMKDSFDAFSGAIFARGIKGTFRRVLRRDRRARHSLARVKIVPLARGKVYPFLRDDR